MHQAVIQPERIRFVNDLAVRDGRYVLYWMQQSQRAEENHALEYAIACANEAGLPLLVVFGLTDDYPDANLRHYTFLLEGLREVGITLAGRGIALLLVHRHPAQAALEFGRDAALMVCDRGYLRHQRQWRHEVAQQADCRVVQVESDVVVPVEAASAKAEYAARTIRPKLARFCEQFLLDVPSIPVKYPSTDLPFQGLDFHDPAAILKSLRIDRRVMPVSHHFQGGTSQAKARFRHFLAHRLAAYDAHSNQPQTDDISGMSPYLHFGQISPLYLALQVMQAAPELRPDRDAYLEQLLVRRELAMNFVYYTDHYDEYACLPSWAARTLDEHRHDEREYVYPIDVLERADTHDEYWNAAMREMLNTGFMHNYMRMYWGKKILEWTAEPDEAFARTLELNNRYFLDGRDPNSYTGVAWLYGVHDRAWGERPVFGKIRYMAASGLRRKCDMPAYLRKVHRLSKKEAPDETF